MVTFVLCLLIADSSTKKGVYKQGTVRAGGPCCVKIVFALLTKVIAVYTQFFIL